MPLTPVSVPLQLTPYIPSSGSRPQSKRDNEGSTSSQSFTQKKIHNKQTYYCEPCDKELPTRTALETHNATHENCSHAGCKFNATKRVVAAHFHASHGQFSGSGYKIIDVEGQKFRVLMGTSPEEVELWRQERRSRFPSRENVERKQKEISALVEAGGIQSTGRKRGGLPATSSSRAKRQHVDGVSVEENVEVGSATEDDQGNSRHTPTQPKTGYKKPCALFARGKCDHGEGCKYSHDFEPKPCTFFEKSGRCRRGSRCSFLHDRANRAKSHESGNDIEKSDETMRCNNRGKGGNKNGLFLPKPFDGGARGSLLRNLLSDQISTEENIVLQCLRFLVSEKFFDNDTPT